ncbi:MAG: hypothetical protein GX139_10220 [Armatimonadetes bacterium]|nr:hypothetical protein [Armatimonadota bacterium]
MTAAVAKAAEVKKTTSASRGPKKAPHSRRKRIMKARFVMFSTLLMVGASIALPFIHTSGYAKLKKISYAKSEYEAKCWRERVENERLKVLIDQQSSYIKVKDDALKLGMVPATRYDFLDSAQVVASK